MKPTVAIIGAGRIGTAIGILLSQLGYPIGGVVCRSPSRAREAVALIGAGVPFDRVDKGVKGAGWAFLTVPDRALPEVASQAAAARRWRQDDLLIHTSGALPAGVLRAKGAERAKVLAMHPVQTVAEPVAGARRLRGVVWGLDGDPEAIEIGRGLVEEFGGKPVTIAPGKKAFYHAAACVASNYLVTLVAASLELYAQAGLNRQEALAAVTPLMVGTLANIKEQGIPWALTGPIERGDVETVARHLEAMAAGGAGLERLEGLYRMVGLHTLELALEKGRGTGAAHQGMRDLLQGVGDPRDP